MRLSGYQPQYFPRLHYFARILSSDIFEISDYVQFVKKHAYIKDGNKKRGKSYQADTPIKSNAGLVYLTVPVSDGDLLPINKTPIDYTHDWRRKHLKSIEMAYSKSKNFNLLFPEITSILSSYYKSIGNLNTQTILWGLLRILGEEKYSSETSTIEYINKLLEEKNLFRLKKVCLISETSVSPPHGTRDANEWLVDMCKYFDVSEYYFGGTSAAAYMDFAKLKNAHIELVEQNWKCKEYRQRYSQSQFIPNLSIIDLLMNAPIDKVHTILSEE